MPKRKLVIDEKEDKVLLGVMKENADPILRTVEGTLENALGQIPQLLADAEVEWAKSLKRPAYKPPVEAKAPAKGKPSAKTATAAAEAKPGATTDLPLLAGTEPAAAPAEAAAAAPAEATTTPPAEAAATTPSRAAAQTEAAAPTEPAPAPAAAQEARAAEDKTAAAPVAPAVAGAVTGAPKEAMSEMAAQPASAQAPAAATPSGQWQYTLKDGRGPFDSVQEAMDAMGMDKSTQPQHNRWDRLSTALKETIRRVEKKV